MDLRKLLKCPVTVALLILWAVLSVVGYLGKDTIYKNYTVDIRTTPYFVLVFDGLHDGIFPWSHVGAPGGIGENGKLPSILLPGESVSDTELAGGTETVGETETEEAPHTREFCVVDDDWFDDAVFIGDSRTVGLRDYGWLNNASFYGSTGIGFYDMWTEKFCEVDGEKTTLEDALSRRQFGKIYFQIGINEMGRGTLDGFMEQYAQSVQKFRELQPDAIIYVQGIMRVAKAKSDSDKIFNNQGINERNMRIAELADNQTIFYIDVNDVVCDADGNLRADLTFDNLHLYGSKYGIWVDFLKTKGIAP